MTEIEAHESWWQRWGVRLLPVATFVAGLVLSAVVVWAGGGDAPLRAAEPTSGPSPSEAPAENGDTVVTLPGACEDAAENITEATRLIDEVVTSVRDFQPDELVSQLNDLEDLDAETRPLAEECSTAVDVSESASPSESEAP